MEDITRRNFIGAAAAAGLVGATGIKVTYAAEAGSSGADEAGAADDARAKIPTEVPTDPTLPIPNDVEYARLPNGRIDPLRLATKLSTEQLDDLLDKESEVIEDYTTSSGKVIPALYVRVRNRFNRLGVGVGSLLDEDKAWDVIMDNWSEEEAEAYLQMPLHHYFSASEFAEETGRSYDDSVAILDQMAGHSLIMKVDRTGAPLYLALAPLWGMWEFNMDKFDKDWCTTFNQGLGQDFALAATNSVRPVCHIVPVSQDVVDGDMAPYTSWKQTLEENTLFSLAPCQCRKERDVLGTATCTPEQHDRESCISVGEVARYLIDRGVAREITREQAIDKIQGNIDKGMVVEKLFSKKAEVICLCHSDCCKLLSTYYALNGSGNMMQNISAYDLQYDKSVCIKCGTCIERCPMEAITFGDDGYCVMDLKCIRCGQCAVVCPVKARSLKAKEDLLELPNDMAEDYQQFGRIRMAMGYVEDFTGDK